MKRHLGCCSVRNGDGETSVLARMLRRTVAGGFRGLGARLLQALRNGSAPDVRRSPRNGEFIPYYQPVIDLESGACLGVEVPARRQHPRRGLLELGAPISRAPRQSGAGTAPGRCPYADEAAGPLILLILIAQATCERSFPFGAFTNLA